MPLGSFPPTPAGPDDYALLSSIATGDQAALRAFYDRHSPLVFALAQRMLSNHADAEDLLIDIFAELWDHASRYDASRGSPLTYLTLLTRSRCLDRLRSRPAPRAGGDNPQDIAASDTPASAPLLSERQSLIRTALDTLEASQREAINCAFYEGLSHTEIAQKLNKPLGTIKSSIRQGLIRLRDQLRTFSSED